MSGVNEDTDRIAIDCDDTEREIAAQAVHETTAQMFEDTGVMIVNRPPDPAHGEDLVVTFRPPPAPITFRPKLRARTIESWPPAPRAPAVRAPRNAAILATVCLAKR